MLLKLFHGEPGSRPVPQLPLVRSHPSGRQLRQQQPEFSEPPLHLERAADHWNFREDDDDYYSQPGMLFRLMSPEEQNQYFGSMARALAYVPKEVKIRHIGNCLKADPAFGKGMADALGIPLSEVPA
jgi:catalase